MTRATALRVAAWIAVLGVLAPFVVLAFYAHPQCDDVYFASEVRTRGLLGSQAYWYQEWSSRYASNFMLSLWGLMPGYFTTYAVVPLLLLVMLTVGAWRLIAVVAGDRLSRWDSLLAATAFVTLYLATLYSTREAVYWASASYTYQSAAILLMFMLAELLRQGNRWRRGALAALMAFAATGMNEITIPVLLVVPAAGAALAWRYRRKDTLPWLMTLGAVVAGVAIVLAAPGNDLRNHYNPDKYSVPITLQFAAEQWIESTPRWVADIALVGATGMFVWLLVMQHHRRALPRPDARVVALATAMLLVFPYVLFTLVPWTLGWDAPWRVVEHVHYLFLAAWFVVVGGWTAWALHRPAPAWLARVVGLRRALPWVLAVVLVAGLWLGEGTRWVMYDLLQGRAARYDRQMRARYAQLDAAREAGVRHVYVDRLDDPAISLMYFDISPATDDIYSRAWASVFGLETIAYPPLESETKKR